MHIDSPNPSPLSQRAGFATTRWSVVLAAGQRPRLPPTRRWRRCAKPIGTRYTLSRRRRGCPPEDAADLTQGFFARLLDQDFLRTADQQRGRFRSFLLTVFKRYLSHEHQRQQTQKRGGGRLQFSIDVNAGEQRYQYEPTDDWTAEKLYERRWALTLLDDVMARLESEYRAKDKAELFTQCKVYLVGSADGPGQAAIAEELGMTPAALRVAVHRMRQRYKELLQEAVAQTIGPNDSIADEITRLRMAVRGHSS